VRNILSDIDEADAAARHQTQELAGLLRLHAPPVLASYVVAPLLAEFRRNHPKIMIELDVESLRVLPIEDFDITFLGADESFDGDVIARKVLESEAVLVASPEYLSRRGTPNEPNELKHHDCLPLNNPLLRSNIWKMWCPFNPSQPTVVEIKPVLLANHTDSLLRATLDGAGITSVAVDIAEPYLSRGELVRVLAPWITGRLSMYAAIPSRKYVPQRTRVFLDFLLEKTRQQTAKALKACST
jgi:DNA-binding transcriptional LysR family regulator